MARNEPSGDNRRVGPVRKRTQLKTKVMGKARRQIHGLKREKKFKGVRREKKAA